MASGPFASHLGAAAAATYMTAPLLSTGFYPSQARFVLSAYRRAFGSPPGPGRSTVTPRCGWCWTRSTRPARHATDRRTVISRLLGAPPQRSVLGPIAIAADGESSLDRYGIYTIENGKPTFQRAVALPADPEAPP